MVRWNLSDLSDLYFCNDFKRNTRYIIFFIFSIIRKLDTLCVRSRSKIIAIVTSYALISKIATSFL